MRAESGVALGSRQRGVVVNYDGFRPGHLADPALRFRVVGMLVRDHPDRDREHQRAHGGRHQKPGEETDLLHRGELPAGDANTARGSGRLPIGAPYGAPGAGRAGPSRRGDPRRNGSSN